MESNEIGDFLLQLAVSSTENIENVHKLVSDLYNKYPSLKSLSRDNLELILTSSINTDALLTFGGDDRVVLNLIGNDYPMNKYYCSTKVIPGLIQRSSCTCSSITSEQHQFADEYRKALLNKLLDNQKNCIDVISKEVVSIIDSLVNSFNINSDKSDVVLLASGTDAEYIPLLCVKHHISEKKGKIINIIVASEEVGSGTVMASSGNFFNKLDVNYSQCLSCFSDLDIDVVNYHVRNNDGIVDNNKNIIIERIIVLLEENPSNIVIAHAVMSSKTGLYSEPSVEELHKIQEKYSTDRMLIVVDACQLRTDLRLISYYANTLGCIVFITGSKFFACPPFEAAIIYPKQYTSGIESQRDIKYFSRYRSNCDWNSIGLLLRWKLASNAIANYAETTNSQSDKVLAVIQEWTQHIYALIKRLGYNTMDIVQADIPKNKAIADVNTIISVCIYVDECTTSKSSKHEKSSKRRLTFEELKLFYKLMSESLVVCGDLTYPPVLLGQPVLLSSNLSIIRIALSADMLMAMVNSCNVDDVIKNDEIIINKILYLASNWNSIVHREIFMNYSKKKTCVTYHDVACALSNMIKSGIDVPDCCALYDIEAVIGTVKSLQYAFQSQVENSTTEFIHCFAMKSCPLYYICKLYVDLGLGMECASIAEVQQAINVGCKSNRIVFDSPCKTKAELLFSLQNHIHVNANSFRELDIIADIIDEYKISYHDVSIGVRVNPLVGEGKISELSTATVSSKFGIPITHRQRIVEYCKKYSWLNGLMIHVGSQGMPLTLMIDGAIKIVDLALEIGNVVTIDIGGGLCCDTYTFDEYAIQLRRACPALFTNNWNVITEFGKSLVNKTGVLVGTIQDIITNYDEFGRGGTIAISHIGADLLLRDVYSPNKFSHIFKVYKMQQEKSDNNTEQTVTIAGPLCFSGDIIAKNIMLPPIDINDKLIVMNSGANTMSLYSRHCSRPLPAVFVYYRMNNDIVVKKIKNEESIESILQFWDTASM